MKRMLGGELQLDDDPNRIDMAAVHDFLANYAPWALGWRLEEVSSSPDGVKGGRLVLARSTMFAAVAALTLGLALSACGNPPSHGTAPPTPSPIAITTSPFAAHENSTQVVTAQPPGSLQIVMTNGQFNPDRPQAAAGDVSFYLVNPSTSAEMHQMTILDASGRVLAASSEVAVETAALFTVHGMKPGAYHFYCAVDGHRAEGMIGILAIR